MAELLRIALVYPELLGTYGDRGNAEVLAWHAVRHGLAARLVEVPASEPVPAGLDAYLLGGGEDAAQAVAARLLRSPAGDGLRRAVDDGRAVLAVCGAFQLLGRTYTDGGGREIRGLGLLDVDTAAGSPRLVGEVVTRTREGGLLSGFENHGGRTLLGGGVEPLGTVVHGAGNNGADGTEGARRGSLLGTYLHGPVLARNPALADLLLGQVLARRGLPAELPPPAPNDLAVELHLARLRAVLGRRLTRGHGAA
ncbi:MAG TPA: glutamine amidotransferase [Actinomycetes bacterium]|jgi:CobQ-like glutamine amidotransferase family enzyme|nr:glutamine amidotransferase [Actinomycetes bacterium]